MHDHRVRLRARAAAAVFLVLTGIAWPAAASAGPGQDPGDGADTAPLAAVASPRDLSSAVASAPSDTGEWGPLLDWGVQAKHMVTLSTGKVLVWATGDNARVWDPTTGTFTLAPATFGDLHCAGQSTLADGRVIVVGGVNGSPHDGTNITAIFDPVSQTWTRGADMTDLRWYATSTTLADGKVLATSGDAPDGTRSTIPELYDPATDTWTRLTGAFRDQGLYPFMFVLPNGRTYESGSKTGTATIDVSGTGSWTPGPSALYSTSGYSESAVMYLPGKILRAGGGDPAIARAMVVDMTAASPAWREIAPMAFARRRMNLTILADGSVMAIGGTGQADNAAAAVLAGEIWNPVSETWTTVASMGEARMYHSSSVLLPDGRIVVGGGEAAGRLRAQIYSPPYLFKGPRPTITSSPGTAAYGSEFQVSSPGADAVVSVALLRPTAATHALDMNQRYVPLAFSGSGTTLTVSAPASGGIAPPGDYMLVIKDGAGVPSVASWIRIGTTGSLEPGTISGTVTDAQTSSPLEGVMVSMPGRSTTTDASGQYALADVPAGDVQVSFAAAGYATAVRTTTVTGGAATSLDVGMARPGNVAGSVTSATTGDPVAGVTVGYPGGVTLTDALGRYAIDGLGAGVHPLTFAAAGFVSDDRTVVVQADQTTTLDVALTPTATWVAGEVRDATTTAVIPGATVSVDTGETTTTDAQGRFRIDLPPGSYTVTAAADGHVTGSGTAVINGGSYATLDFNLAPVPGGSTTLPFAPTADAYVKSTNGSKNYGTATALQLRLGNASNGTTMASYLRFDVTGLAGRPVSAVTLRLRVTDSGPLGGNLYLTAPDWTETGVTWNNAPAPVGQPLATIGAVTAGQWLDVTLPQGTVTGDGPLALVLRATGTNSVYYASGESLDVPRLDVTVGGAGPTPTPTATPTPTPSPTATPSPTPTPIPSPTPTPTPTPPAGTNVRTITFEGGLLDPTTGVDSMTGTVTLEAATPIHGTASARFASTTGYLQESFPAISDAWMTMRVHVGALPTGSPRILQVMNAGTTIGNITLSSTGRLRLRNGTVAVGAESSQLLVGNTYLIGLRQSRGSGTDAILEAFVAPDGAPFGAPFAGLATGTWTASADRIRFGATNGTPVNLTVDDVLLGSGSMPAPVASMGGVVLAAAVPGSSYSTAVLAMAMPADRIEPWLSFACPIPV